MGSYEDTQSYRDNGKSSSAILKTYHFKLVLLGETSVGKSCIVHRFAKDEFCSAQESTIGAAFMTQSVNLGDSIVKFEIWDTAGQERYRSLAPMYYRGAAAAVIVYDVTSWHSYTQAQSWLAELRRVQQPEGVIAIAGNKDDLEKDRAVPADQAREFAQDNDIMFIETSAKTGHNVNELFHEIARRLPKNRKEQDPHAGFQINKPQPPSRGGWCQCG